MANLKLRSDLPENFRVTKQVPGMGMVMFNSEKVQPQDYHKWQKMGFADLFEEVIETVVEAVVDKVVEEVKEFVQERKARKARKPKN